MRASAEYDLLLTQRLVLQPEAEVNFYSEDDPDKLVGTGLSDLELGLRLRYEIPARIRAVSGRELVEDNSAAAPTSPRLQASIPMSSASSRASASGSEMGTFLIC